MTANVSLERLESTVNLVHFQSTEYLSTLVKEKLLHFQNARKYSQEVNIVSIDSKFYAADAIGIFCFSYDMKAVFNTDMWHRFGTKTGSKSVCVGFWEFGAEAVANTSGVREHAIELSKRNHRKMINNHHNMSETVFVGRPDYLKVTDLDNYKHLPQLTKNDLEMASEILLLTFEPDELSLEYEERFIVFDCPDYRDVSYSSRFIPRPKVIILGPEVDDPEVEQFIEEYRNHVNSIWKARIGTDGRVAVLRALN